MEDDRSPKGTPSTGNAGNPPPPPPPQESEAPRPPEPPSIQPASRQEAPERPPVRESEPSQTAGGGFVPHPADEWLQGSDEAVEFSEEEYPTTVASYHEDEYEYEDEPQKVRLAVSRIDPLSTLKLSFLVSVAVGIGIVVATASVWLMLDGMGVFTQVDELLQSVAGDEAQIEVLEYFEFNKVISLATIVAVVDVIVLTILATLGVVVYNLIASLIGGIHVTLTDE